MKLVPTGKSKDALKKHEELWNKIRDLIRSITKKSESNGKKYMKIKFNSDDDLPLKKTLELYNLEIVVRSVFHKANKYYQQVF